MIEDIQLEFFNRAQAIFGDDHHAEGGEHFVNSVIDFGVDMIWSASQDDDFFVVFLCITDGFVTKLINFLMKMMERFVGFVDGVFRHCR